MGEEVGITQKSAWFVLQRIRNASETDEFNKPLENIVEIDETYIGGKAENMHMSKRIKAKGIYKKTIVLGMIERNGKVIAKNIKDTKANTLKTEIYKNIKENSLIITDELNSYKNISNQYNHQSVNHSNNEYSKNYSYESRKEGYKSFKIHTNSIEGYWAFVKRGIYGIHHFISNKHSQKYINFYSFIYNTKNLQINERFDLLLNNIANKKLTYKSLITC